MQGVVTLPDTISGDVMAAAGLSLKLCKERPHLAATACSHHLV